MPAAALADWLRSRQVRGERGLPRSQPLLAVVARLTATLRAADRGDGAPRPSELPDRFRALLAGDAELAEGVAVLDAHLARCRGTRRQPPPGDGGRGEALDALTRLAEVLRYRVSGTGSDSRGVIVSAGPGRK